MTASTVDYAEEWLSMKGGISAQQLREIAQREKQKILQRNGTLPKSQSNIQSNPRSTRRVTFDQSTKFAAAAVMTALTMLHVATAQSTTVNPLAVVEDQDVLLWQLIGALAIWSAYRLSQAMLLTNRGWRRVVNVQLLVFSSVWTRQMLGAQTPILHAWRNVIAAGYAPATFAFAAIFALLAALAWRKAEGKLRNLALKS